MTTENRADSAGDGVDGIRARLGQLVRETWVNYCLETGDTKPSHIAGWEAISDWDREVDCRIGEAVAKYAENALLALVTDLRKQLAALQAENTPPHPDAKRAWMMPPVVRIDYPLDEDEFPQPANGDDEHRMTMQEIREKYFPNGDPDTRKDLPPSSTNTGDAR